MAKYPKKIVDLANGGIFRRVVAKHFHFSKATREAIEQAHEKADDLAAKTPITRKRNAYVGSTPSKNSQVGQDVIRRMDAETPPRVRGWDPDYPDDLADVQVKGSDGKWYALEDCDMGHSPIDAVTYWNNVGRYHGPRSDEVRDWMRDPDNYELQPSHINQADGRIMGNSGFTYQPPVTLPDGVDIAKIEPRVLEDLKDFKGTPVP